MRKHTTIWVLLLSNQGRTEEAKEHYLQALRINPESEKAHYNLGLALHKQGRTEECNQALFTGPADKS